jgi:hypothetical protein
MATPQQHQIAELAYRIWERQGRPEGRDREHWEQAQRELQGDEGGFRSDASSAQVTPGVVKDGKTQRARRSD